MLTSALLSLALSGCSIVSPLPLWELAKAGGAAAGMSMGSGPVEASDTVFHPHEPFQALCIEFNPQVQAGDMVLALQDTLLKQRIQSRVYESIAVAEKCHVWLKYQAEIEWGIPPMGDNYRPYLSRVTLTLRSARGTVLSTSSYAMDPNSNFGKWTPTRDKLTPVVTALLTGVASPSTPNSAMKEGAL